MAEKLGVSESTYSAWETGRNTPENIVAIAEALENITGVRRTWWLGWGEGPSLPDGDGSRLGESDSRPSHYE